MMLGCRHELFGLKSNIKRDAFRFEIFTPFGFWNSRSLTPKVIGDKRMKQALLFLLVVLFLCSIGFSRVAAQEASSAHVWRESVKTDANRGTVYNRYTLTGKFLKAPQRGDTANRPALVVDCNSAKQRKGKAKFEAASLLVGAALKIDYVEPSEIRGTSYYPKVSARYRMNDGKEEEEKWDPGSDKASASMPKVALRKILRAQTVDITVKDDTGTPIVMKFDMPNATAVEQGCSVDN
jgi:hypothetical protein